MIITSALRASIRRAILGSCLALSLFAVGIPARADNPPKFSDAAATAYFQKVSDIIDNYIKAIEAKDEAKSKDLDAQFNTVMKDGDAVINKLPPADQKTAGEWYMAQVQKLMASGYNPK